MFFLLDIFCLTCALSGAILLRFETFDPRLWDYYRFLLPLSIPIAWGIFRSFGLYQRALRYASIHDLIAVLSAVSLLSLVKMGILFFHSGLNYSRAVLVLDWILGMAFIGATRFIPRVLLNFVDFLPFRKLFLGKVASTRRRVLIVGAGRAGEAIVREIRRNEHLPYHIVGFIDDSSAKLGQIIHGIEVLGDRRSIERIVIDRRIQEIIIAVPSATGEQIREIVQVCRNTKVKFKTIPGMKDLIEGKMLKFALREISLEDLLQRASAEVDLKEIATYLTGKVVLVTGAGGSIGSEICRQIIPFQPQILLLLGQGENSIANIRQELSERRDLENTRLKTVIADIKDQDKLLAVFNTYRPQIVFHAAAHKHVPLMEENPEEAVKNNVLGTFNLVRAAHTCQCDRFVMISSDKAVNPTSVMGASKRVAEQILQSFAHRSTTRFCAVRFGNVLGSRGSVIPLFKRQIEQGGPVTITHPDMVRYFMTIPEASKLTIQAGAYGNSGEIFLLDMGTPIRVYDLARDLIRLAGLEEGKDIRIEFTGIRAGEKLYEEMLTAAEGVTATKNKKIFVAKPELVDEKILLEQVSCLSAAARSCDRLEVIRLFHQIIPTYTFNPENHPVESLFSVAPPTVDEGSPAATSMTIVEPRSIPANGKILLTGATGFVGRTVLHTLLENKYRVRALHRRPLPQWADSLASDHLEWFFIPDLNGLADPQPLFAGIDAVVHLAARVHHMDDSTESDALYYALNVKSTELLAEAAIKANVCRFIYASSIKAMGEATNPGELWNETTPCRPLDPYGRSKLAAEDLLRRLYRQSSLPISILRTPLVYGAGVKGNLASLMRWIDRRWPLPFAGITNARSFLGVENYASAILAALAHPKAVGKTFIVADEKPLSTPALVELLAKAAGQTPNLVDMPSWCWRVAEDIPSVRAAISRLTGSLALDPSRIMRELDWHPSFPPETSFAAMFREHRRTDS